MTVGGEIDGNCAKGSEKTEIPPARVITMESTAAKMGRSMKKRENIGIRSQIRSQVSGSGAAVQLYGLLLIPDS